jgi:hypothetical protein
VAIGGHMRRGRRGAALPVGCQCLLYLEGAMMFDPIAWEAGFWRLVAGIRRPMDAPTGSRGMYRLPDIDMFE